MNSSLTCQVWPRTSSPLDPQVHGGARPGSPRLSGKRSLGAVELCSPDSLAPSMERTTLLKPWEMGTFGGGPLWSRKASALEIARTPFPSPRGVQQERGAGAGSLFGGRRPGLGLQLFRLRALPLPLALAPTPASRFARLHVPGSLPSQIPGERSSRAAVLPVPGCGEVGGYAEPAPRSPPRHRSSSRGSAEVRRGGRGRCTDNAGSASGDPGSSPRLAARRE